MKRALALLLAVLMLAPEALLAATPSQPQLPDPGDTGVSKEQQIQLGHKVMGEVYQQMPVLPDDNPLSQYVRNLGQKLAGVIPQQYSWPFEFHVIQQKDINAFALPGGPIFINVGTVLAANNEAQLAGVMAHEMAHVYMQHSIKQMKANQGPSILAGLGQILGQMIGGVGGALASIGGQITGGLLSMKYSRKDEAQADSVGAIIAYKRDYNPQAIAQFFEKLEQEAGRGGPQFLSDHPNPGNRYAAITEETKNWPPKQWTQNTAQFQQAKSAAQKVKVYTAQQIAQGAKNGTWARQNRQSGATPTSATMPGEETTAAGGSLDSVSMQQVRPSSSFRQYEHQYFRIKYPGNWQVFGDSQGGGVTIAPTAGVAEGAIAYGAVINGAQAQDAANLDDAVQQLISGLQHSNPGLTAVGNPQRITVNGVQGRSVDLRGTSPVRHNGRPLQERDWLVALPTGQGRGIIYVVFVAPENNFGELRPTFEQMLRSLHLQ